MKREYAGMNAAAWREACERGYEIPKAQAHQLVVELLDEIERLQPSSDESEIARLRDALRVVVIQAEAGQEHAELHYKNLAGDFSAIATKAKSSLAECTTNDSSNQRPVTMTGATSEVATPPGEQGHARSGGSQT